MIDVVDAMVRRAAGKLRMRVDAVTCRHAERVLLLCGLPKSGTEWMNHMLLEIPGYHPARVADSRGLLQQHRLDAEVLASIDPRGHQLLKTHCEATEAAIAAIIAHDIPTLVMWRDLRDQAVSRYYHVRNEPGHRHHALYTESGVEQAISHAVDFTLEEYVPWVEAWEQALADGRGRLLLVRYENLRTDTAAQFRRVLEFFRIDIDDSRIGRIIEAGSADNKRGADLAARIASGRTFRGGRSGDWRSHFSQRDIDVFKARAGECLVRLGYEEDLEW